MIHIFFPKRIKRRIGSKPLLGVISAVVTILFVMFLFAVFFMVTEGATFGESLWQAWQTITTVGYGNAPASTDVGRLVTAVLGTLGLVMLGPVIAKVSEYMEEKKEKIMTGQVKNPHRNAYVIFNYPGDATIKKIIKQWRATEPNVPVCIVDGSLDEKPKALHAQGFTHFVSGSLLDEETYKKANLSESKQVIVYPKGEGTEADATTATISNLASRFVTKGSKIICVVRDVMSNKWLFASEKTVLIDEDLETTLIVQECQDPYTAPIIEKLLSNTEGADPMTVGIRWAFSYTWFDFQRKIMAYGRQHNVRINCLALVRNEEPNACPDYDTQIEIGDKVSLIVYAEDNIDWPKIEEEIFK